MFNNMIQRIAQGAINNVNDSVAGGGGSNIGPQVGLAPGQLGTGFWLDDSVQVYTTNGGRQIVNLDVRRGDGGKAHDPRGAAIVHRDVPRLYTEARSFMKLRSQRNKAARAATALKAHESVGQGA